LSSGTNYPSVVISLKGSNIIIYRAKMEANIYRPNEQKELITPTIEQEIM
jgi:hypothetical protein